MDIAEDIAADPTTGHARLPGTTLATTIPNPTENIAIIRDIEAGQGDNQNHLTDRTDQGLIARGI